jgi:hypothetical protein
MSGERSSHQFIDAALAQDIGVTVDTVKRWIDILGRLHDGFLVRPYPSFPSRRQRDDAPGEKARFDAETMTLRGRILDLEPARTSG